MMRVKRCLDCLSRYTTEQKMSPSTDTDALMVLDHTQLYTKGAGDYSMTSKDALTGLSRCTTEQKMSSPTDA